MCACVRAYVHACACVPVGTRAPLLRARGRGSRRPCAESHASHRGTSGSPTIHIHPSIRPSVPLPVHPFIHWSAWSDHGAIFQSTYQGHAVLGVQLFAHCVWPSRLVKRLKACVRVCVCACARACMCERGSIRYLHIVGAYTSFCYVKIHVVHATRIVVKWRHTCAQPSLYVMHEDV